MPSDNLIKKWCLLPGAPRILAGLISRDSCPQKGANLVVHYHSHGRNRKLSKPCRPLENSAGGE